MIKPDSQFENEFDLQLGVMLEAAADEGANVLDKHLKAGARSGVKYRRLPRRSSAPGQYPQEQSGELRRGVGSIVTDDLHAQVIINDKLGKLLGLEFSPPSKNPNQPGTPKRAAGGRAPMWTSMTNPASIKKMEAAMRKTRKR